MEPRDLQRVMTEQGTRVSEIEIRKVIRAIERQPAEDRDLFFGALGLDGKEISLSKRSKTRDRALEIELQGQ